MPALLQSRWHRADDEVLDLSQPWVVVPISVAFAPAALFLLSYCCCMHVFIGRSSRRSAQTNGQQVDAPGSDVRESMVAKLRLRARITFATASVGWILLVTGMTPSLTYHLAVRQLRSTPRPSNDRVSVPPFFCLALLAHPHVAGSTLSSQGYRRFAAIYGDAKATNFLALIPPGSCIMALGVFPTDARAVQLHSAFLLALMLFILAFAGGWQLHRLFGQLAVVSPGSGEYTATQAEIVQAIVVSTYATAILLKVGLLVWRRRPFTPQFMLQQQWKWLTITLMMAGSNHLLYAALRYELDIRVWYDDARMYGDLVLGASALCSGAITCRAGMRERIVGLCALRCRPTQHDRGAAETAGLSLYERYILPSEGTCTCRAAGPSASAPCPGASDPALNTGEPVAAV